MSEHEEKEPNAQVRSFLPWLLLVMIHSYGHCMNLAISPDFWRPMAHFDAYILVIRVNLDYQD